MIKINIQPTGYQSTYVDIEGIRYTFEFRFLPSVQIWVMNILKDNEVIIKGVSLTLCGLVLKQQNFEFDLFLVDSSKSGIDPYKLDDFNSRIGLYLLEPNEITEIRGYAVSS
ncbi:MAG: hypothetical protein LBG21_02950 [Campylobacteraceae bacterium]|jgi:hypothetical protein|nr:hypothetical protein [Campylobacteraceae bacterium]